MIREITVELMILRDLLGLADTLWKLQFLRYSIDLLLISRIFKDQSSAFK